MSRHNSYIEAKNAFVYENTYLVLCNGSWTPGSNVSIEEIYSSAIALSPPIFGLFSSIDSSSWEVTFSFLAPDTNETVTRIALFKKDPNVDYGEFYRNVTFIPPNSVNVNIIYNDIFVRGEKLYNPLDNTIYTILFSDGYNSLVTPDFNIGNSNVNIIKIGESFPIQLEEISPITLTGQQLSFKWSIDNGNSPT